MGASNLWGASRGGQVGTELAVLHLQNAIEHVEGAVIVGDDDDSGLLFVGDRGVLSTGFTGGEHRLYPESRATEFAPPPATIERSKGHYQEWVAACKGGKPAFCEFGFGGALTELVLLGNLAVRGPAGKTLEWDAAAGRTSDAAANAWISEPYRTGW